MSVTELQKKLVDKINNTHDLDTLEEISSWIILNEEVSSVYQFSDEQIIKLEEAEQQIKDGNFYTNAEANKETDKWLKQ